eukprot:3065858-Amphidinium_carterae.1
MTIDYYDSLLSLYNVKNTTNSLATTSTRRPPIETNEYLSNLTTEELEVQDNCWKATVDVSTTTGHTVCNKKLTRAVQKPDQHDQRNGVSSEGIRLRLP